LMMSLTKITVTCNSNKIQKWRNYKVVFVKIIICSGTKAKIRYRTAVGCGTAEDCDKS
ncbi:hypothetical protein T11_1297, partial [Trichinella zimbabwensis]